MNIVEFVQHGGKVVIAGGCNVTITDVNLSQKYCLTGLVHSPFLTYTLSWDKDGNPEKLPTTHGQNLLAVMPEIKYNVVSKQDLKEAKSINELRK